MEVTVRDRWPSRAAADHCVGTVSRMCIDDSGELIHITVGDA